MVSLLGARARAATLAVASIAIGAGVGGDTDVARPRDSLLFTISKSENKNEVQYAIRVDEHCAPSGEAPIWAYWRMLERSPSSTEPLLPREQRAYGIANQSVQERGANGGKATLTLMAVPARPIAVETFRAADGECAARALATVSGERAILFNVYVKLRWPVGVSHLLLQGWTLDGQRIVTERLET
jgi:hypothetical protein